MAWKRISALLSRESRHSMTKIIQNEYARIWERDRKFWANLHLPATGTNVKRTNVLLLRKVVNTNLRKKQECPEQYRSKAEYRRKLKLTNQRADHAARKMNKIQ
ncbi:uncharacterized protein LOC105687433 [Athalia rosae]|uniref:uncharacterized protein LOC105687433 n=1 Tax=Athalia rosae TaxID=37344 RepID=UPI002033204C|nr:uncharacterized protein LOC105687433 [Athalia rosae]